MVIHFKPIPIFYTDNIIEKVQVETLVAPNDPACVIDDEVCPNELYEERKLRRWNK